MRFQWFSLVPFTQNGPASGLKIAGKISRAAGRLGIHYALLGHLEQIVIPVPSDMPARQNALWKETCFEFFIAVKGSSRYWEFNLSPAGHWNVFRFAAYRNGMQEETAIGRLPFSVRRQPGALSLFLEFDLDRIIRSFQAVEAGISAVIQGKSGRTSYWALTHSDQQADFHRRDSFIVEL